jgi:hypothetical protein
MPRDLHVGLIVCDLAGGRGCFQMSSGPFCGSMGFATTHQLFDGYLHTLPSREGTVTLQVKMYDIIGPIADAAENMDSVIFSIRLRQSGELREDFVFPSTRKAGAGLPKGFSMPKGGRKKGAVRQTRSKPRTRKQSVESSSDASHDLVPSSGSSLAWSGDTRTSDSSSSSLSSASGTLSSDSSTDSYSSASSSSSSSSPSPIPVVVERPLRPGRSYFNAEGMGVGAVALDRAKRKGKGCRHCGKPIQVGHLRVFWHHTAQDPGGYIHPDCLAPRVGRTRVPRQVALSAIMRLRLQRDSDDAELAALANRLVSDLHRRF